MYVYEAQFGDPNYSMLMYSIAGPTKVLLNFWNVQINADFETIQISNSFTTQSFSLMSENGRNLR